jgi:hypothetical protein
MQSPQIRSIAYKLIAASGAVIMITGIQVAQAQVSSPRNPFCIRDGVNGGGGSWDCSYHTWQQCLDSASGAGGWCTDNPNYQPRGKQQQRRKQQPRG